MFLTSESKLSRFALFIVCLVIEAFIFMATAATAGQPLAEIPSLNATVTELLFYESGEGYPPKKDRIYSTEFNKSQVRYINWELNLKYPRPSSKTDFKIRAKYYRQGGNLHFNQEVNSYISPKWTSSNHSGGCGNKNPDTWKIGQYRVELFVAGSKVASGSFRIVSGKGSITPPGKTEKKSKKSNTDIPDDLGEL
jgi:hypothetical protein